jgi:hypothetical protein
MTHCISIHAALRNLYHSGYNTEPLLQHAHYHLMQLKQVTDGYVLVEDLVYLQSRLSDDLPKIIEAIKQNAYQV